ncbi:MAG: HAMP domain-containing sensor histidine kinase [Chthoniobacteraceae bacterium]
MNPALFADILSRLQVLILVREADGSFRPEGLIPAWFASFGREAIADGKLLKPASLFAFLEHFLPDAEHFWESDSASELRSGFWTEDAEDGTEIHLEATACRVAGEALLLVRRIETEFDQLHRALQRGREVSITHERLLSETNKKEILLHCIVHDLSGPLSGVTGALDILRTENLSPEARRFLELGRLGVRQQANFISDLLDSFRAEIGSGDEGISDPTQAPDLIRCTREVIATLKPAFVMRDVVCRLETAKNIPARQRVVGEWNRLLRVLHNLLQNALRHSSAGGIVTVSIARDGAEMVVNVDDHGPGIAPDVAPQLFQKFVRGRGLSGKAGLGLFFCRITVEQWGGTIGCGPREGSGTRFWFRLKAV